MDQKHSREPWRRGKASDSIVCDYGENLPPHHAIGDMSAKAIESDSLRYYGGHLVAESATPSNISRIVACVNACAGIPTEALEAGVLGEILQFIRDVARYEGCPGGCKPCAGQCDTNEWKAIERDDFKEGALSLLTEINS